MNISLVQPLLSKGRRANNLSNLKGLIQAEARRSPAPDLIVLPDCCVATQEAAEAFGVSVAMCQGFAEAFACWAREWGIWILVGHSLQTDSHLNEVTTLFDPDGDPFIRAIESSSGVSDNGSNPWVTRVTPIGCIALRATDSSGSNTCPPIETNHALDLIVSPSKNPDLELSTQLAQRYSSFVASPGCALEDGEHDVQSFILDRTGALLAKTTPGKASTVGASIQTLPRSKQNGDEWEVIDGIE